MCAAERIDSLYMTFSMVLFNYYAPNENILQNFLYNETQNCLKTREMNAVFSIERNSIMDHGINLVLASK